MTQARLGQHVVVLGAGMVGIACAISLRQRGLDVTVSRDYAGLDRVVTARVGRSEESDG